MNIFRLAGDLSHLAAIIILLLKIWKTRSCAGISGKYFYNILLSDIVFDFIQKLKHIDAEIIYDIFMYFRAISNAICTCVYYPLLGSFHKLHLGVQHSDESFLPNFVTGDSLSDVC